MSVILRQIFERGRGTAPILQPRPPAPFEQTIPVPTVSAPSADEQSIERDAEVPAPQFAAPNSERATARPQNTDAAVRETPSASAFQPTPQILAEPAAQPPAASVNPSVRSAAAIQSQNGVSSPLADAKAPLAAQPQRATIAPQTAIQRRTADPASAPSKPSHSAQKSEGSGATSIAAVPLSNHGSSDAIGASPAEPTVSVEIGEAMMVPEPTVAQPAVAQSNVAERRPSQASDQSTNSIEPAVPAYTANEVQAQPAITAALPQSNDAIRQSTPAAAPLAKGSNKQTRAAQTDATSATSPPKVEIRIGRIDVPVAPTTPAPAPVNGGAIGMSLDAFLAEESA